MISRLTPLNGNWLATPSAPSATSGNSAITPRYTEPGAVSLLSTYWRYSAVGRPGLMPGMNPPYFFMLSATSVGLKVIDT